MVASSTSAGSGQLIPAPRALLRYSFTVLRAIRQTRAICLADSPCCFSLKTSLIFRIDFLLFAKCFLLRSGGVDRCGPPPPAEPGRRDTSQRPTPSQNGADFALRLSSVVKSCGWNAYGKRATHSGKPATHSGRPTKSGRFASGMGGRFAPESVAGFKMECLAGLPRNPQIM